MQWILRTVLGLGVTFSSSLSVFAQTCNVTGTQPGKMALVMGNGGQLSSRPDQAPTAQLASVTLTCTGGMQLSIDSPVAQGSTPSTATSGVQVWDGSPLSGGRLLTQVTGSPTNISLSASPTDRNLFFNLYADSVPGTLLTPGSYAYSIKLTITPQ